MAQTVRFLVSLRGEYCPSLNFVSPSAIHITVCFVWIHSGNYAHGKEDLKFRYTTLRLMESSGQIVNADTHLSRPCITWVSTGAW
jgi:hypothetical protein